MQFWINWNVDSNIHLQIQSNFEREKVRHIPSTSKA